MIKYCLFPVAGFGTRFLPVTKTVPKELLPIIDKPLIQYAIDEAYESGISEMILVINEHKLAIKKYFEPFPYLESLISSSSKINKLDCIKNISDNCSLNFINQTEMLGLGHAILQCKELTKNESFGVILPDDLCFNKTDSIMQQMIKVHEKNPDKCVVAIERVDYEDVNKYGIISGDTFSHNKKIIAVKNMTEKPRTEEALSNLAIIGRYILTKEIYSELEITNPDLNGEIQITDALRNLAEKGKVLAYIFDGTRLDCGSVEGFIEANIFFRDL